MKKRIVFFGSSPFSIVVLKKLLDNKISISQIVTANDKPAGRHLKLTPNPLARFAQDNNLNIIYDLSDLKIGSDEIGLVVAYGKIISKRILEQFSGKLYNIHPSLLPKYRGASPLQQQILDGVSQTGVTIIQLDNQMDHGPIVAQIPDVIQNDENWIELGNRLFDRAAEWFIKNIDNLENINTEVQDESQATYTKKLSRQDGFIEWNELQSLISSNSNRLMTKFKAYYNWPGVWSLDSDNQRVRLVSINPLKLVK